MAIVTRAIVSSGDDGYIVGSGFYSSGTSIQFGNNNSNIANCFLRFTNITIPRNVEIVSATVTFVAFSSLSGKTLNVNIHLCNEDNASAPTSAATYNAKTLTTGIAYNDVPAFSSGNARTSDSFASEVQTVVNRAGWSSGNAICIMIKDNSSSLNAYRLAHSYDSSAENAPSLSIEYATPIIGVKYSMPPFRRV